MALSVISDAQAVAASVAKTLRVRRSEARALAPVMAHGSWWALQHGVERLLSLGIHVELRRRVTNTGVRYGPYIDIHLPGLCVSFGRNPIYAGELDLICSTSRGGLRG